MVAPIPGPPREEVLGRAECIGERVLASGRWARWVVSDDPVGVVLEADVLDSFWIGVLDAWFRLAVVCIGVAVLGGAWLAWGDDQSDPDG